MRADKNCLRSEVGSRTKKEVRIINHAVMGRSIGPAPAVETSSREEPWTNSPQLSTFSIWEENQVWGESTRPSGGYEAINKRFVVNKLVNISARCSFLSLT